MHPQMYLAFVLSTVVLIAIPGPNVALIVANSIAHGRRMGLITVAGTTAAMVPQPVLTIAGVSSLFVLLSNIVEWIRWIGVAYLAYLGVKAALGPPTELTATQPEATWHPAFSCVDSSSL